LDTVQKTWAPLRKLFATTGVISWLRACCQLRFDSFTFFALSLTLLESCFSQKRKSFQDKRSKRNWMMITNHAMKGKKLN